MVKYKGPCTDIKVCELLWFSKPLGSTVNGHHPAPVEMVFLLELTLCFKIFLHKCRVWSTLPPMFLPVSVPPSSPNIPISSARASHCTDAGQFGRRACSTCQGVSKLGWKCLINTALLWHFLPWKWILEKLCVNCGVSVIFLLPCQIGK